jgi:transketolase
MLEKDGVSARVVSMPTVKPLDEELVVKCAKETGFIVTAEEHFVIGGLGSAVAECLCEKSPAKLLRIGVNDRFGESGTASELMKVFKLDAQGVYDQIKASL